MQTGMNPMMAAMNIAGLALSNPGGASSAFSPATQGTAPTPFAALFTDAVDQVGKLEDQAHAAVTGLMTGSGVDVHQAMIATEKASMSFELALAVRNKAVQAYQSVIGMQF